jgi:hypothetical protein
MKRSSDPFRQMPHMLLLLAFALAACAPEAETADGQKAPETVDVGPAVDVDPDRDQVAVKPKVSLVGVLPDDFPKDVPVYIPSSVTDFGRSGGKRFVLLQAPHDRAQVEAGWRSLLSQQKVRVEAAGGRWRLLRGQRVAASAAFAKISGGTEIRIEY